MGWLGGGVGAAVGGALLGPLGLGAGAALGALLEDWLDDEGEEQSTPALPISLSNWDSREGRTYLLEPQFDASEVAGYAIRFRREDGSWVRARGSYEDDDGDFVLSSEPLQSDGSTAFFVPRGSLVLKSRVEDLTLEVATIGDEELLGITRFDDPQIVAGYSIDPLAQARPLLDVAHSVVSADGTDTLEDAASVLRDLLDLARSDEDAFRRSWELAGSDDLPHETLEVICRLPGVGPNDILDLVADLLRLRSTPSPEGVALAQVIAVAFDINPHEWADEAGLLGFTANHTGADDLAEAYDVLGLLPGAGFTEVRDTYRALMKDYHPDVVAHLPQGYQEYATMQSQEINAAYQLVLADLQEGHSQ